MSIEAIYKKQVSPEMLANLKRLTDECQEESKRNHDRYEKIHLNICKKIYGDPGKNKTISLSLILETVCHARKLTIEDARAKNRKAEVVLTRQIYMYIAKKHSGRSLTHIGTYIDRDHATVLHSNKALSNWMDTDKKIKELVEEIESKVIEQAVLLASE